TLIHEVPGTEASWEGEWFFEGFQVDNRVLPLSLRRRLPDHRRT
ncbi:hypothetical protein A2U01_0090718, partial [Trifolium medium]|nr:hypothetical protein [Trifolium medium]